MFDQRAMDELHRAIEQGFRMMPGVIAAFKLAQPLLERSAEAERVAAQSLPQRPPEPPQSPAPERSGIRVPMTPRPRHKHDRN